MLTQPFYTSKDFAALVGKSERTINNILTSRKAVDNKRRSELPPFKRVAGRFVISINDMQSWLDSLPAENAPVINAKRGRPRGTTNNKTK